MQKICGVRDGYKPVGGVNTPRVEYDSKRGIRFPRLVSIPCGRQWKCQMHAGGLECEMEAKVHLEQKSRTMRI